VKMKNDIVKNDSLAVRTATEHLSIDAGTVFYDFLVALSGEMYSTDMMYFVMDGMRHRLLERGCKPEDVDKATQVVAQVLSSRRKKGMHDFMG
jgi:hypothetical protein